MNVMNNFNSTPWGNGIRQYTCNLQDVFTYDSLPFTQSRWMFIPFARSLIKYHFQNSILCPTYVLKSPLQTPIPTNTHFRLSYRISRSQTFSNQLTLKKKKRRKHLSKLSFANKGLNGINFSNILHHKSVHSKTPSFFKYLCLSILIPIPNWFQLKFSITYIGYRISIWTISILKTLIAPVLVPIHI